MATLKVEKVEVAPAVPAVVEEKFNLSLNKEEAEHLLALLGGIGGQSRTRVLLTEHYYESVYHVLYKALGSRNLYLDAGYAGVSVRIPDNATVEVST